MAPQNPFLRRIGILGGSFNPAHAGHREISLAALDRLGLDAVWWLVTPGSPLKDPDTYADFDARLEMARAVADHDAISVSDFERREGLQYTVDTLARLRAAHPDCAFVWLMGADSLATFHRWKDWRRIADLAPIAVFNRPGSEKALKSEAARALDAYRMDLKDGDLLAQDLPAWTFIPETRNEISSTALRAALKPDKDSSSP